VEARAVLAIVSAVGAVLILASLSAPSPRPLFASGMRVARNASSSKWIVYAAALIALIYALTNTQVPHLADWALAVNLSLFPFAVAIAILRHHMYDIDLVIRRTLVYGLVSGILGLGYAGTVLILGQLFGGVSRDTPSWAIAASTLTVAALFQPVRRRIQRAVDRRFNCRRHDASQTIATFADRLHQQLDLDALSAELLQVVGQTMEPTTASLWLRQPQDGTRSPDR
jgi:hypothetical protein